MYTVKKFTEKRNCFSTVTDGKTGKKRDDFEKNRADSANLQNTATDRPQRTAAATGGIYQAASRQSLTGDLRADSEASLRIGQNRIK